MEIKNPSRNFTLTLSQQSNVLDIVNTTINCLDDDGLNELLGGYNGDINRLFDHLYKEAVEVLNFKSGKITNSPFGYLDHFSKATEEAFRIESLAYFIDSVLPNFTLGTFHIEWSQLVQLHQYLCVLAARDHCFSKGTKVRMFDGTLKNVEDVSTGDKVMGVNSQCRTVLNTHSGVDDMYKIDQEGYLSYSCNSLHKVVLINFDGSGVEYVCAEELSNNNFFDNYGAIDINGKITKGGRINVNYTGKGEYFGFELDGDHLFLGEDGTILHNSKSYFFSYAYILWNLYRFKKYDPLIDKDKARQRSGNGMLITNEIKLAMQLLDLVKDEIDGNDELRQVLMPDKVNEGWAKEAIRCKNGAKWVVKSAGSKIRGSHPETVIIDDYLNDQVLYSKSQSQKSIDIFRSVIMNAATPAASVTVVGTPFMNNDLYGELKKDPMWRVFEYPAIYPDGSLLFPERHTFDKLMAKKSQGSVIFSREILVRPISDDSAIFTSSIITEMYRETEPHKLVSNRVSVDPKKFKRVVMGCDFAISANTGADYTCFLTVGVDYQDRIWILNIFRKKGLTFLAQKQAIERLYNNFKHDLIMMETNGFQAIYKQEGDMKGLPIVDHKTHSHNKKSIYEGLPGLAALAEVGRIKFASGDQRSKDECGIMASELMSIMYDPEKGKMESVSENDDTVMALWIACRCAMNAHKEIKFRFI